MNPNRDRWQRVLAAFKAVRADASSSEKSLTPPPGFVTRVAARASAARRERSLALWRRWSLRAAMGSTCLCLIAVFYAVATQDGGQILPIPSFDLPSAPTP